MLDPRLDLSRSPIKIPERFQKVLYDEKRYPGAPGVRGVTEGANCQQYAYEFVRAFGFTIPDFRSSDLWADTAHTHVAKRPEPFDLVLVNNAPISWGAHVGVYLGSGFVLHLSKKLGVPAMEPVQSMMRRARYRYLLGFKRILVMHFQTLTRPGSARHAAIASATTLQSDGRSLPPVVNPSTTGLQTAFG
jgi:murein DD-endopeptidase / murein LD-carboxypeptidase